MGTEFSKPNVPLYFIRLPGFRWATWKKVSRSPQEVSRIVITDISAEITILSRQRMQCCQQGNEGW